MAEFLKTTLGLFAIYTCAAVGVYYVCVAIRCGLKKKFPAKIKDDPLYDCEAYKEQGCCHVDGPLCDMKTCIMLKEFRNKWQNTSN